MATKARSWGLRPTGKTRSVEQIGKIVKLKDGSFQLNMSYFKPLGSNQGMQVLPDGTVRLARHFSDKMETLFGAPREPYSEITQRDMDLAYAMQHCFEEAFFHLLHDLHRRVPDAKNLAMAGGCALNSVANGKIFARTPFRRTWIQPAAGDEGLAIGAALYAYHAVLQQPRREQMEHAYLGPEFSDTVVEAALKAAGVEVPAAGARAAAGRGKRMRWLREMWWAGFRGAWNGGRGRWETGRL